MCACEEMGKNLIDRHSFRAKLPVANEAREFLFKICTNSLRSLRHEIAQETSSQRRATCASLESRDS